jgi:hypothetical protein
VNVWLWDVVDPDGHSGITGVTDREDTAISHAEALLSEGQSSTARVEQAYAHMGGMWIHSNYERIGSGLTAARTADGSVRWTRFYRPALAAS